MTLGSGPLSAGGAGYGSRAASTRHMHKRTLLSPCLTALGSQQSLPSLEPPPEEGPGPREPPTQRLRAQAPTRTSSQSPLTHNGCPPSAPAAQLSPGGRPEWPRLRRCKLRPRPLRAGTTPRPAHAWLHPKPGRALQRIPTDPSASSCQRLT